MPAYTDQQNVVLSAIRIGASVISMLGSGFIVVMYCAYKDLRKFAFKLVFMLSICDIIMGFGTFLADGNEDNNLCRVQAVIIQFGSISGVFWTLVVAYAIREILLVQPRNFHVEEKMPKFHIVVWSSSLFLTILPFFSNSYGDADGWCWISKYGSHSSFWGTFWRMVCFYIPLWVTIVIVIVIYRRASKVMDRTSATFKRIRWYPMVLIATYFFATVDRVWQIFGNANYELCVFRVLFVSLAGLFNVLIYGLTPAVKDKLRSCRHSNGVTRYDKLDSGISDPYSGRAEPLLLIPDGLVTPLRSQEDVFIPPGRDSGDVFINSSDTIDSNADGI
jgi:hypothetical protein